MSKAVIEKLKLKFGPQILETHDQHGDDTAVVTPAAWKNVCEFLRSEPALDFDLFVDMCGVDFPNRVPRMEVVLHLYSTTKHHRLASRRALATKKWAAPSSTRSSACGPAPTGSSARSTT